MGSWILTTPNTIPSLNDVIRWKVNGQQWRYAKERKMWRHLFGTWALVERIPAATTRRRLRIVRVYAGRQREYDPDNLSGGCKPLIDALKPERVTLPGGQSVAQLGGLLMDDNPTCLLLEVEQRRGEIAGTEIMLEDLP